MHYKMSPHSSFLCDWSSLVPILSQMLMTCMMLSFSCSLCLETQNLNSLLLQFLCSGHASDESSSSLVFGELIVLWINLCHPCFASGCLAFGYDLPLVAREHWTLKLGVDSRKLLVSFYLVRGQLSSSSVQLWFVFLIIFLAAFIIQKLLLYKLGLNSYKFHLLILNIS